MCGPLHSTKQLDGHCESPLGEYGVQKVRGGALARRRRLLNRNFFTDRDADLSVIDRAIKRLRMTLRRTGISAAEGNVDDLEEAMRRTRQRPLIALRPQQIAWTERQQEGRPSAEWRNLADDALARAGVSDRPGPDRTGVDHCACARRRARQRLQAAERGAARRPAPSTRPGL